MDKNNLLLVLGSMGALVIVVIAGILLAGRGSTTAIDPNATEPVVGADFAVGKVSTADHIIGNQDAEVVLVEYSDTECPFCKDYHTVVNEVVKSYQPTEFAWVYRHLPLEQIHSKATNEAVATECAAQVGGKAKFWEYLNRLYEVTPSNNNLDPKRLPEIATEVGINRAQFEACQKDSSDLKKKVDAQAEEAFESGATGTPYNVFIVKTPLSEKTVATLNTTFASLGAGSIRLSQDKTMLTMSGGLPAEYLKLFIDTLRGKTTPVNQGATSTQATSTEE